MSGFDLLHLLRPWWLLGVPLVLLCGWLAHQRESRTRTLKALLPEHLSQALTMGQAERGGLRPVDTVLVALMLMVLAAAGPTWSKQPSPWFAETAPLLVALEVTDSMRANDLLPTRLDRARFKILDLIATRTGARTALIAYAGSAHVVMPPTEDVAVIKPFLESLDPRIMPLAGANAAAVLDPAVELLGDEAVRATVLFVTDGFAASDIEPFRRFSQQPGMPGLVALVAGSRDGGVALLPDGTPVRGPGGERLDTAVDEAVLSQVASAGEVPLVRLASGDADIRALNRIAASNLRQADDPDAQWLDQGWWFLLPAALLILFWFRRGWTMQW